MTQTVCDLVLFVFAIVMIRVLLKFLMLKYYNVYYIVQYYVKTFYSFGGVIYKVM